jgi:hypothetical protein
MEYREAYTLKVTGDARTTFHVLEKYGYTCAYLQGSDYKCVMALPQHAVRCGQTLLAEDAAAAVRAIAEEAPADLAGLPAVEKEGGTAVVVPGRRLDPHYADATRVDGMQDQYVADRTDAIAR